MLQDETCSSGLAVDSLIETQSKRTVYGNGLEIS